jgi:hypothetical protein
MALRRPEVEAEASSIRDEHGFIVDRLRKLNGGATVNAGIDAARKFAHQRPPLPGRGPDAFCSLCGSMKRLGWRESDNVCFCGDCIAFGRHTDITIEEVLSGSIGVLKEMREV